MQPEPRQLNKEKRRVNSCEVGVRMDIMRCWFMVILNTGLASLLTYCSPYRPKCRFIRLDAVDNV